MKNWLESKLEISHGKNKPLLSMEGLRGVAVFLVFWVHYSSLMEPYLSGASVKISHFIHSLGHLGVDLFFVLSGYLIYGSVLDKKIFSSLSYAKRRIQRIYPTFLVVFIVYIVLSFIFPSESKLPSQTAEMMIYIIQNLLLLPGIFDVQPIITVAWSLSYEVFYYLLIPIVIFGLNLKSWTVGQRIYFWVIISVVGLVVWMLFGGPVRLLMFISGILLFEFYTKKQITLKKGGDLFLILALVIFGLRSIYNFSYLFSISAVFILFLLLCLCAFNTQSRTYRWLTFKPVRWLGNMSYSYYLIHGLTLKFCFLVIATIVPAGYSNGHLYFWLWAPLFVMTLFTSFALFLVIERPFSLQINRLSNASNKIMQRTAKASAD
ncbi:acyltransferase [Lacimicrobium sp. SS2-24]|uniref:acyltransferase family protein n=1 Tax=Lacimicrobium sp. SS2-24 TaxID=2005569 RepID=UPI000B4B6DE1|nr:acyltransferase [Lacimicrobium sp. SS2-24]